MPADLTLGASLLQGVGAYETGRTRSLLFRANASIATQQAQSEREAGAYGEQMVRMRGAALQGQQIAQIGASNLQQGGTPATVVASSALVNEMDALQTRNNALRKAWGFEVQGASDQFQSKQANTGGIISGVGSILSGGAKAYEQYNQTGSFF
jgi:hypothetical protein